MNEWIFNGEDEWSDYFDTLDYKLCFFLDSDNDVMVGEGNGKFFVEYNSESSIPEKYIIAIMPIYLPKPPIKKGNET